MFRLNTRLKRSFSRFRGSPWKFCTSTTLPVITQPPSAPLIADVDVSLRLWRLVIALRIRGHFAARLDPLNMESSGVNKHSNERRSRWLPDNPREIDTVRLLHSKKKGLDLSAFGLENCPQDVEYNLGKEFRLGPERSSIWSINSIIEYMTENYCGSVGVEFAHIENFIERKWLIKKIETEYGPRKWGASSTMEQQRTLDRLMRCDHLEKFLGTKFQSSKRFGIEGCESLLPGLWSILEVGASMGVEGIEMGMAHRGRLNVLHNFVGKSLRTMCNEFSENELLETGDVKYHLGTRGDVLVPVEVEDREEIHTVHVSLAANPSHLEAVNPVVIGKTKAKQFYLNDHERRRVMPILLHGDASFSGQGIVPEVMELSELPDYTVGGCVHIVINNQIGFTTNPSTARTSYHCTNAAKGIGSPIFHVNGDDVDAVVQVCRLAAMYRQTFNRDCVVDIVCYRKHGHNELDDPMITQPLTYKKIKNHPTTLDIYKQKLLEKGVLTAETMDKMSADIYTFFENDFKTSQSYKVNPNEWLASNWQGQAIGALIAERPYNQTGVAADVLLRIGYTLCHVPTDIEVHPEVLQLLSARKRMLDNGKGFNIAFAETLAFGTLMTKYTPPALGSSYLSLYEDEDQDMTPAETYLALQFADRYQEKHPHNIAEHKSSLHVDMVDHPTVHVRLSGQDCVRGTFNQRHAAITCQETSRLYVPLNNMARVSAISEKMGGQTALEQATFTVCNSSLSETAVLGFEYGYSLSNAMALTIWEAQFGDFVNVAQMIIDNFIVSGESKWNTKQSGSALVMLLPHGYDGQGPEHSSARLERFLSLTDDDPDVIPGIGDIVQEEVIAGFDVLDKFKHGRIRREDFGKFLTDHALVEDVGHRVDLAVAELFSESGRDDADFLTRDDWVNLMTAWGQRNSERRINIFVVNPTTPAQYFHVLRRQIHRPYTKPLIVMTAKWMLHHKRCVSSIDEFLRGTFFQRLIVEGGRGDNVLSKGILPPEQIKRAIFCSGKIFYHLLQARNAKQINNITLIRLEQLAPFPYDVIIPTIHKYLDAELIWCQEEPKNMGAWSYVRPRLDTALRHLRSGSTWTGSSRIAAARTFSYIGRKPSAASATGSYKVHVSEMKDIMEQAMKLFK